jgi:hypothetical protein
MGDNIGATKKNTEALIDSSKELNYWVMHPVARVSIKYWNNLRTQQSIF